MATLDLPMLVEDPLLMRCDSLWGEADLLSILNCDLALDEEFPLLAGLQELAPPPAAPATQQPLAAPAPQPPAAPLSPQTSIGSGTAGAHACIYLANAVSRGPSRRSASPSLSGNALATPNLPALQGSAWRTVTTAPASASNTNAAPPAAPPCTAPFSCTALPRMPSSATSGACGPASSSEGMAAPPAAKAARTSAGSRSRRAPPASSKPAARKQPPVVLSEDDTDSEDSNDTEEHMMDEDAAVGTSEQQQTKSNKRKAPEIDWRSIEDPAERRRQRRLAKNRVTAARSRERKKSQWAEMEEKLNAMEAENRSLRQMLESISKDNEGLRAQLAAALGGSAPAAAGGSAAAGKGGRHTHEPAVLVLIVTLLLCAFLPTSGPRHQQQQQQGSTAQGPAALGGALLLAELLLQLSTKNSYGSWSSKPGDSPNAPDFEPMDMLVDGEDNNTSPASIMSLTALNHMGLLGVKPEPGAGLAPAISPLHTSPPPGRSAATAATSLLHALLLCVLAMLKQGLHMARGLPPLLVRSAQQAAKSGGSTLGTLRQHVNRLAVPTVACVM